MRLRTIFRASVALAPIALMVGLSWDEIKEDYTHTPSESEITTPTADIEPAPPLRLTIEPPIAEQENDEDATTVKYSLSDFAESIPKNIKYFFDLSLQLEEITNVDSYIFFAKTALETMHDIGFAKRANHGVKGARGIFQLELANVVSGVRAYGRNLKTVDGESALATAIQNHGRAKHLKQMSFYKSLDKNDPLRKSIDRGWQDSNEDGVNDLDLSKSEGFAKLSKLEKDMIRSWNKYTRIADGLLVEYIAKQASNKKFETKYDKLIYDIPYQDLVAGELSGLDVAKHVPEAKKDNFNGTWEEDMDARNTALVKAYGLHNMGKNGAKIQLAIAANPEWALVKPQHTEHLKGIIKEVAKALGTRGISAETLALRAKRNPAVFQEGKATRYGCLPYNIVTEAKSHMGSFLPIKIEYSLHDQKWYEGYCGRDPLASHRPKIRPTTTNIATNEEKSLAKIRPRVRPENFGQVRLTQN